MCLVLPCSCHCAIHWSHVLSREWCSWSNADRRCSNYIWVINIFLPTKLRLILDVWGLTAVSSCFICSNWNLSKTSVSDCGIWETDDYWQRHFLYSLRASLCMESMIHIYEIWHFHYVNNCKRLKLSLLIYRELNLASSSKRINHLNSLIKKHSWLMYPI